MEATKVPHKGMFRPGQSGNPSGRPKTDKTIRDLARAYTSEALEVLVEIAFDKKASYLARIQAANGLLDRGWGRPVQYADEKTVITTFAGSPSVNQDDLEERILGIKNGTSETPKEADQTLLQFFLE